MASPHRSLFDGQGIPGIALGCASLEKVVRYGLGTLWSWSKAAGQDGAARSAHQTHVACPVTRDRLIFNLLGPPWFRPNSIFIVHVNDDRSWMGGDSNLTLVSRFSSLPSARSARQRSSPTATVASHKGETSGGCSSRRAPGRSAVA